MLARTLLKRSVNQFRLNNQMMTVRCFGSFTPATLKPLPYPINGLEPVISQKLMEFHYGKHHQTYVNNLNGLYEKAADALENGQHQ